MMQTDQGSDQGTAPNRHEDTARHAQQSLRLLVVVNVFEPDCAGGAAVFSDLCHELARRGMEVTVRCAYPYYPEWRDKSGKNGWRIAKEGGEGTESEGQGERGEQGTYQPLRRGDPRERRGEGGVVIERYGLYIPSNPGSLWQRLLYEGSFGLSLMRSLPRGRRFDVVMAFCPLMGSVMFAAVQRLVFRQPLWLNVQDLPADAAAGAGLSKGKWLNRLLQTAQTLLFNRADVWRSISPVMVDRLAPLAKRNQPIHYLPDHLHESMASAIGALPSNSGRPLHDPPRLFYSGNIGGKQDLLHFCRRLAAMDLDFRLLIRGEGGRADEVRQWVEAADDARFTFESLVDEAQLARNLHEADFFMIPEKHACGSPFIPSKMILALAAGTPVLAVCDAQGPLGVEMETHRAGPRLDWDRLEDLSSLIGRCHREPEFYEQWRSNALARSTFYDRKRVVDQFERLLHEVAEGKRKK